MQVVWTRGHLYHGSFIHFTLFTAWLYSSCSQKSGAPGPTTNASRVPVSPAQTEPHLERISSLQTLTSLGQQGIRSLPPGAQPLPLSQTPSHLFDHLKYVFSTSVRWSPPEKSEVTTEMSQQEHIAFSSLSIQARAAQDKNSHYFFGPCFILFCVRYAAKSESYEKLYDLPQKWPVGPTQS